MMMFVLEIIFRTMLVLANAVLLLCTAWFFSNEKKKVGGAVDTATKVGYGIMIWVFALNIVSIAWG